MQALGSVASVVAAIREDAAAEVERIEETMAGELAAIRADAVPVVIADREQRIAGAHRLATKKLAQQEWEGRRAVIEQREAWIARVAAAAAGKCDARRCNARRWSA